MDNKDIMLTIRWFAYHEAEKSIKRKFIEGDLSLNEFYLLVIGAYNSHNKGEKLKWHQWKYKRRIRRVNEGFEFLIKTLNNKC